MNNIKLILENKKYYNILLLILWSAVIFQYVNTVNYILNNVNKSIFLLSYYELFKDRTLTSIATLYLTVYPISIFIACFFIC